MKASVYFIISAVVFLSFFSGSCKSMEKNRTGLSGNEFYSCPGSPNCVSSMTSDEKFHISPLEYSGISEKEAKEKMIRLLENYKNVKIIEIRDNYIHAEFRTSLFRFVDDVEFYFPEGEKVIHVKSASRTGYSDLGKNRKRIRGIRKDYSL